MKNRILIVDDEPAMSLIAARYLSRIGGYIVKTAASGSEAVSIVKNFKPNFVIMDIVMADMDGITATAIIKEAWPDTDIIIVTGQPSPSTAIKAMRAGAATFVPKPYEMRQILRIIESRGAAPDNNNSGDDSHGTSETQPISYEEADAKVSQIFKTYLDSMRVSDDTLVTQDEINELLAETEPTGK